MIDHHHRRHSIFTYISGFWIYLNLRFVPRHLLTFDFWIPPHPSSILRTDVRINIHIIYSNPWRRFSFATHYNVFIQTIFSPSCHAHAKPTQHLSICEYEDEDERSVGSWVLGYADRLYISVLSYVEAIYTRSRRTYL